MKPWVMLDTNTEIGHCLFARRNISRGEVVIYEQPLVTVESNEDGTAPDDTDLRAAIQGLEMYCSCTPICEEFMNDSDETLELYKKLAIRMPMYPGNSDLTEWGIFPRLHTINHSCVANIGLEEVTLNTEDRLPMIRFYALRDIENGEQLTRFYNNKVRGIDVAEERRALIQLEFGFDCICRKCTRQINSIDGQSDEDHLENYPECCTNRAQHIILKRKADTTSTLKRLHEKRSNRAVSLKSIVGDLAQVIKMSGWDFMQTLVGLPWKFWSWVQLPLIRFDIWGNRWMRGTEELQPETYIDID